VLFCSLIDYHFVSSPSHSLGFGDAMFQFAQGYGLDKPHMTQF